MSKPTLTFYLPNDLFAETKLLAVKYRMAYSDLVLRCTLAMIKDDTFDAQKSKQKNDEKTMLYLTLAEKKLIKTATAKYATSISELACQALHRYAIIARTLPERDSADDRKHPRKQKAIDKHKKYSFTYSLTNENNNKLRLLSAETGMTRKQIIMDAVKNVQGIQLTQEMFPKSERSGMLLSSEEMLLIKKKAGELNISVFALLNRSIEQC